MQTGGVGRHRDGRRSRRSARAHGRQIQGQTADGARHRVALACHCQTIDRQRCIRGNPVDSPGSGSRRISPHRLSAINCKTRNTTDSKVRARAGLAGADHQTRSAAAVGHDVGGNTVARLRRVDRIPSRLQGGIGRNRDIVISAILTDFQGTTRNGTGRTAGKRSTGYFRTGGQAVHNDTVGTGNSCVVRGRSEDRRSTRSRRKAGKRRTGRAAKLGQRGLESRQCTFQ